MICAEDCTSKFRKGSFPYVFDILDICASTFVIYKIVFNFSIIRLADYSMNLKYF